MVLSPLLKIPDVDGDEGPDFLVFTAKGEKVECAATTQVLDVSMGWGVVGPSHLEPPMSQVARLLAQAASEDKPCWPHTLLALG